MIKSFQLIIKIIRSKTQRLKIKGGLLKFYRSQPYLFLLDLDQEDFNRFS